MKTQLPSIHRFCCLCAFLFLNFISYSQLPRQWAKVYGGSGVEIANSVRCTKDGGILVAGYTDSKDGDVSSHTIRDYWDLWIVKLNSCGTKIWERSFGGTGYETARDVIESQDGSIYVLGETNSTDGNVTGGFGATKDIWLLKLSKHGDLLWQKRYGGNGLDIGNQIKEMSDGSLLIAASTSSTDGLFTTNHSTGGYTDGALIKLDAAGSVLWSKCFGGTKNDELLSIELDRNRIFLAGYANSIDGDIPPTQKNYDAWLLALDNNGSKVFSKIYGGSQNDVVYSMTRGNDGSLALAGYTTSSDGDVKGAKGGQDYWIINLTTSGTINWQRTLGGSKADYANSIIACNDGYLIGGTVYSNDGDITGGKSEGDFWLVQLNSTGTISWSNIYGGKEADNLRSVTQAAVANEYYLAGATESGNGDFPRGHGQNDMAVIKLKLPSTQRRDTTVCNVASFRAQADTIRDACGFDSLIRTFRPVPLTEPLASLPKADTIFEGEGLTLPLANSASLAWSYDPSISCLNCAQQVASPRVTTRYTLNRLVENCSSQSSFTIVVLKDVMVEIPTAFTPNGDGLNDFFGPAGKVPGDYKMQIYNRNGETVFTGAGINQRWDGYYRGKLQPNGVFIYYIQCSNRLNQPVQKKGTLTLIR